MEIVFIAITKIAKEGEHKVAIFNPSRIHEQVMQEVTFDIFFEEEKEFDLISLIGKLDVISNYIALTDTVKHFVLSGYFAVYTVPEETKDLLIENLKKEF